MKKDKDGHEVFALIVTALLVTALSLAVLAREQWRFARLGLGAAMSSTAKGL